jgi:hypothetical protein
MKPGQVWPSDRNAGNNARRTTEDNAGALESVAPRGAEESGQAPAPTGAREPEAVERQAGRPAVGFLGRQGDRPGEPQETAIADRLFEQLGRFHRPAPVEEGKGLLPSPEGATTLAPGDEGEPSADELLWAPRWAGAAALSVLAVGGLALTHPRGGRPASSPSGSGACRCRFCGKRRG